MHKKILNTYYKIYRPVLELTVWKISDFFSIRTTSYFNYYNYRHYISYFVKSSLLQLKKRGSVDVRRVRKKSKGIQILTVGRNEYKWVV